jgi:hypothetical protein
MKYPEEEEEGLCCCGEGRYNKWKETVHTQTLTCIRHKNKSKAIKL